MMEIGIHTSKYSINVSQECLHHELLMFGNVQVKSAFVHQLDKLFNFLSGFSQVNCTDSLVYHLNDSRIVFVGHTSKNVTPLRYS